MTKHTAQTAVTSYRFVVETASKIANRESKSSTRAINGNRFVGIDSFFVSTVREESPYTDSAQELVGYINEEINQLNWESDYTESMLADKLGIWRNQKVSTMAIGEDLTKLGRGVKLEVDMSVPGMKTIVIFSIERMAE